MLHANCNAVCFVGRYLREKGLFRVSCGYENAAIRRQPIVLARRS